MRRFVQEAKAAAALNHPNIAHIYEIGESDGTNFIAMEFIEGRNPAREDSSGANGAQKAAPVPATRRRRAGEATPPALVHRDLKPDNIMYARQNDLATRASPESIRILNQAHYGPRLARKCLTKVSECTRKPLSSDEESQKNHMSDQYFLFYADTRMRKPASDRRQEDAITKLPFISKKRKPVDPYICYALCRTGGQR